MPMPDIPAPMMTTEGDLGGCQLREAIMGTALEGSRLYRWVEGCQGQRKALFVLVDVASFHHE
jgi:hypothetical protein